ncbi:MAG: SDR family NAD(P)-dependent oxidoreductase [Phycisphaerales bacterium]|jgi:hypothetical protein|nr:SDR family NAD(P)-dependent oxidoreductase [Phycisphaerales bacterium]MDP6311512.1 SDR family NAD(P)-dependent oxidoreductase [Phycisphaerales bacterium]MDP7087700.1 SDR family NAD(P)-dependent oxidoreductase [Phycisphaerales bacterium]MDP7189825.1 SDR family NAD(P)-dependent oxidoreductase [Phycisphaerales bacterium]MDP7519028.1 SDR family NAD(P)-dependent oxidoreductase [Phycisphaerales bacterium]|tara:strand:+ start:108 stop:932 length:825 start_codon:yes stop_codon:yes gene_type:complete
MPRRVQLEGRPIVITGGGTGIGAATALACGKAGMPVVLAGRRIEPLHNICAQLDRGIAVQIDVTVGDHAHELLDAAEQAFGPPWAVFANAGHGLDRTAHGTTVAELREIFDVNFFATHLLLSEAAKRMIEHGRGGHLLASASCVSKFAPPYHGAYAATKAAQDLFCQAMRLELAPVGIHVSTVHPVTTITKFFDVSAELSGRDSGHSSIDHTPRFLQQSPERVAAAIIKCLQRPVPEVWTSRLVRMSAALRMLRPTLMDRSMKKMLEDDRLSGG